MDDDEILLSEFKTFLRRKPKESVIDFDNRFPVKLGVHVHRFEDVFKDTNREIPPNRWSYHRIGLVKKGSGEFITGIYKFKAVENTLIVVPSRMITSSKNWTLDLEGYVALFNIDFFMQNNFPYKHLESKKVLQVSGKPYVTISDKHSREIAGIFETILKEKKSKKKHEGELIALKIIELLIMCERLFDEEQHFQAGNPAIEIVKKFIDLVEVNFAHERSVSFYAGKLLMHPNYLNSLIKKHTGITAKESIQNRLLLETKYLLHSTALSIKEISNQVGFNDPNYFTSFFTRLEKVSPGHYRSSFI